MIGDLSFTIDEIEAQKKNSFNFTFANNMVGILLIQSYKIIMRPQFLDYIRGGT